MRKNALHLKASQFYPNHAIGPIKYIILKNYLKKILFLKLYFIISFSPK